MIFNVGAGGASNAESIKYDNSLSGLEADNVQGAVDELNDSLGGIRIGYDETTQKYGYWKKEADTEVFVPFKSVDVDNIQVLTGANRATVTVGSKYLLYCQIFYNDQNKQISISGATVDTIIKEQGSLWGQYTSNYCAILTATDTTIILNNWSSNYCGGVLVPC